MSVEKLLEPRKWEERIGGCPLKLIANSLAERGSNSTSVQLVAEYFEVVELAPMEGVSMSISEIRGCSLTLEFE